MGRSAGGRSGTLAPAASLVLLRGRERMERTDWEEAIPCPTSSSVLSTGVVPLFPRAVCKGMIRTLLIEPYASPAVYPCCRLNCFYQGIADARQG